MLIQQALTRLTTTIGIPFTTSLRYFPPVTTETLLTRSTVFSLTLSSPLRASSMSRLLVDVMNDTPVGVASPLCCCSAHPVGCLLHLRAIPVVAGASRDIHEPSSGAPSFQPCS